MMLLYIYVLNLYLLMTVLILFFMFLYYYINNFSLYLEFELINMFSMKLEFTILLDWISLLFMTVVLMISVMVVFYSMEYMSEDKNIERFIMLVYGFVLAMILLILSPNMISILIGWDSLGLVSFCLVIYYQSNKSFNSGMVTVLMNRTGDIFILMSVGIMIYSGSWNFSFNDNLSNLIYFLLIVAAFTKSAQIPFSAWLPKAMAAPTPVSALVHSSTLVTAGVYLLIRMNFLLESDMLIEILMITSTITMFMAGLSANFEFDLKKIIALSTLSQLGLMVFCLSMKLPEIAMFHLLTHAMFKSLLFMCAGCMIHNMMGNQDIRVISMASINLPMVSILFNCATMSLCGIPFLSGFYSKDLILEMFMMSNYNKFIFIMLFISMGLTVSYSMRLVYYTFIKIPRISYYMKYSSMNSYMGLSMYTMFYFSIFMGSLLSWILLPSKSLIVLPLNLKLTIYFFMLIGLMMGLFLPPLFLKLGFMKYFNKLNIYESLMWFIWLIYIDKIIETLQLTIKLMFGLELGWIEYLLGIGLLEYFFKIFKLDFFKKNFYLLLILFFIIIMILMFS